MFSTILQGVPTTVFITLAALSIGFVGGIPLALARRSNIFLFRVVSRAAVELLRGIPPIVWLFIIYFGLGVTFPDITPVMAAIMGLGAVSCAYMAEIYRGGLSAIKVGQWEAASALGMKHRFTLTDVIGPQVVRVSVPAAATYAISLLKESSVAFTLGATDILSRASAFALQNREPMTPFLVAGGIYVLMSIAAAWGARSLDARLRRRVAR